MTITNQELQSIADLACLDQANEDNLALGAEVSAIIEFVQQLRETDTQGVAPLFHPYDLHQRLRNDEITEYDCSAQLAEIAPLFEEGMYLVPKVIDSGK